MSQTSSPFSSQVTRFMFEDLDVCGVLVQLNDAWEGMHHGRGYALRVKSLLGEMSAVAALMGGGLKAAGRLTFQIQGQGAISMLVVDCEQVADGDLLLRGMARCHDDKHSQERLDMENLSLNELLGDGTLLFSLQSDMTDMPYQSQVPLSGESMANVFELFMSQSAQQDARLWLFADEHAACALFLQTLPPRERDEAEAAVDPDGWSRIQQLASTVRAGEMMLSPETLLSRLFAEDALRVFPPRKVRYYCPRDEDRVRSMLVSLGRDEVAGLLAEHGEIRIHDEICNQEYRFGPGVLDELFPSSGHTLH